MKNIKKFLSLLAAMMMVCTIGMATACKDKGGDSSSQSSSTESSSSADSSEETPAENVYVVTVLQPDGTPAANLSLNFCVGETCQPVKTDANGIAKFEFDNPNTVYHVEYKDPLGKYTKYSYTDFNTVPGTLTYIMNLLPPASN